MHSMHWLLGYHLVSNVNDVKRIQNQPLVGGVNPFEKYAQVKIDQIFPKFRGENSKNV